MSNRIEPKLRFARKVVLAMAAIAAVAMAHSQAGAGQEVAQGESAEKKLAFEVATIKLAAPNAVLQNRMLPPSPNRISIPSMTLTWLIYTAYGEGMNTSATVTGGPDWMKQTAYAVEGLAHEPATQLQFQAMLRTLLAERFALKIHTETTSGNIYALVVDRSDGKLGPKVQAWDGTCAGGRMPTLEDNPVTPRCLSGYLAPGIFLDGATMYNAADLLSLPMSRSLLGRVVQDRTGLPDSHRAPGERSDRTLANNETVFFIDISDRFFRPDGSHNGEMWKIGFSDPGIQTPAFEVWAEVLQPWLDRFVP